MIFIELGWKGSQGSSGSTFIFLIYGKKQALKSDSFIFHCYA